MKVDAAIANRIMYFFLTLSATTPEMGSKTSQPSMPVVPRRPIWATESPCLRINSARIGEMIPPLKFWVSWTTTKSLRAPSFPSPKDYPTYPRRLH